jgi:hypothetical protein
MIFHHFTSAEFLDEIMAEGLRLGDVPLSATEACNAVWLTTDRNPEGHGLSEAGMLSEHEIQTIAKIKGIPLSRMPRKLGTLNKRAVRITIKIPTTDRALFHWPRWGRKRLDPDWYDTLNRTGSRKANSWWIYFGTIPPDRFLAVEGLVVADKAAA